MKGFRFLAFVLAANILSVPVALAQSAPASPPARNAPAPSVQDPTPEWRVRRQPAVRIGQPYVLGAGEEVPGAVVIWGDMTIDGHVDQDVVNILGNLTLGPGAVVDGSVVSVGGNVTATGSSRIGQDLVIVGGGITAPAEFSPRGDHVVVGSPALGDTVRGVVPWITTGLLWGRVITPGLGWVWGFVFVFLLIYLAIAFAFPKGVAASVDTLGKRPISAFFTGMLTLLLVGPVCALLAVSIVGLIVVPFVMCALVAAWMLGKTAVMRWMGAGIVHEDSPESRAEGVRSLLIGFAIVTLTYMIPVLGVAAWALVGMTGLGSATLTALATLRRERPAKPPKPARMVPPSAPAVEPLAEPPVAYATSVDPMFRASAPVADAPPPFAFAPGPAVADDSVDLRSMPRATLLDRVFAGVLDALLVAIAVNLLPFHWWFEFSGANQVIIPLLIYHVAFWAWKGTTVGSIICNLRVIRTDGQALRPVDAIVRGLSSIFSAAALGIGFLYIGLDSNRERQAWHDKIAGTLVVRVPKDWPLP